MRSTRWTGALCAAALLACLLAPRALAQHGGGGGGHGGGMPGGGMGPGGGRSMGNPNSGFGGGYGAGLYNRGNAGPPPRAPESAGTTSGMRGGLQLGPPGRWWDDKHFAKDLKLRPDQQQHMDSIFEANRAALIKRLQDSHQEENRLESLAHSKNLDEGALGAQIDRVWQARAELEKAYTHYLLQIRSEMDADQLTRLEEHR